MREIKFRVYEKFTRKMIPWGHIKEFAEVAPWLENEEDDEYSAAMQFTGLYDKNGREIYEGDILRVMDGDNAKVLWSSEYLAYYIEWLKQRGGMALSVLRSKDVEIIGNIYENPELYE